MAGRQAFTEERLEQIMRNIIKYSAQKTTRERQISYSFPNTSSNGDETDVDEDGAKPDEHNWSLVIAGEEISSNLYYELKQYLEWNV